MFPICVVCSTIHHTGKKTTETLKSYPELSWDYTHVSFGEVIRGEIRDTIYKFTNTGTDTIWIELVTGCECTELEYPEMEPIAPRQKGVLKVSFHSADKEENELIDITVLLSNTDPETGFQMNYPLTYDYHLIQKK